MVAEVPLFKQITDLLTSSRSPQELLALKATEAEEHRYQELVQKSHADLLSNEERNELARFEAVEHIVRMAKIEAYIQLKKN